MQKQFVTFDIAVRLKDEGFDEPCLGFFNFNHAKIPYVEYWTLPDNLKCYNSILQGSVAAPLWQQAIIWYYSKGNSSEFYYLMMKSFNSFLK